MSVDRTQPPRPCILPLIPSFFTVGIHVSMRGRFPARPLCLCPLEHDVSFLIIDPINLGHFSPKQRGHWEETLHNRDDFMQWLTSRCRSFTHTGIWGVFIKMTTPRETPLKHLINVPLFNRDSTCVFYRELQFPHTLTHKPSWLNWLIKFIRSSVLFLFLHFWTHSEIWRNYSIKSQNIQHYLLSSLLPFQVQVHDKNTKITIILMMI